METGITYTSVIESPQIRMTDGNSLATIIQEIIKELWYQEQPYRRISGKPCPYNQNQ